MAGGLDFRFLKLCLILRDFVGNSSETLFYMSKLWYKLKYMNNYKYWIIFVPFLPHQKKGEKWGSKNRRNVFKLRPGNNNDTYNTSDKSESFWFSSYRDIGQKRNSHTKSLKNSISQRRIRLLDLLTSSLGLLWCNIAHSVVQIQVCFSFILFVTILLIGNLVANW